jgi:hypothetical protein
MPESIKRSFEEIAKMKTPGPSPSFSIFQLIRALELIGEKEVGRGKLAEHLSVGEGAVRTIIGRFKAAGLVSTAKAGCSLTKSGLGLLSRYRKVFRAKADFGKTELVSSNNNLAILVKNCGGKVKSGMEQRDAAIKIGAETAVTIVVRNKHLVIPSVSNDLFEDFPRAAHQIMRLLSPVENDAIVIAGADDSGVAAYGALAAAWTLVD